MFVSKNRALMLIALAAILSSANSFGGDGGDANEPSDANSWWNWRSYVPDYNNWNLRRTLPYYTLSTLPALAPFANTALYKAIPTESIGGDLAKGLGLGVIGSVTMPSGVVTQVENYYEPTREEQRRARFLRSLALGTATALGSSYLTNAFGLKPLSPYNTALLSGAAGVFAGAYNSNYETLEAKQKRLPKEINYLENELIRAKNTLDTYYKTLQPGVPVDYSKAFRLEKRLEDLQEAWDKKVSELNMIPKQILEREQRHQNW